MAESIYRPEIIGRSGGPFEPDVMAMRHGRTLANRKGIPQTGQDPMDNVGRGQVRRSIANVCGLIATGVFVLNRPLVVHHGPLPRQQETCEIALDELAHHDIRPAYVEKRDELAERFSVHGSGLDPYDPHAQATETLGHTWYHVLHQLHPYLQMLEDKRSEQQVLQISSGGTLGIEKILMLHGLEGALAMLQRDTEQGPDAATPESSDWFVNKVPNAAIDGCRYVEGEGWTWEWRVMPTEPLQA